MPRTTFCAQPVFSLCAVKLAFAQSLAGPLGRDDGAVVGGGIHRRESRNFRYLEGSSGLYILVNIVVTDVEPVRNGRPSQGKKPTLFGERVGQVSHDCY